MIDPNVGALKDYLTDITTSHTYNKVKDEVWNILGKISKFGPNAQAVAQKVENAIKTALLKQSNLFESLNFRYFGPVDGHDVNRMVELLRDLKDIPGPKILHCVTVKGKGYQPAENGSPTKWHAPGLFNKETGEIIKVVPKNPEPPNYQDVFGHTIVELAERNPKIVGITPAMPTGCSLKIMMDAMPDRAFDVGIAEQHAVTFSAGLATQGMVPFCNIYSSFMQRAYDQVVHDVALQNLHVVFCLDRAGFAGADGPTHHGAFDIAYFRCIPNMVVSAPINEEELRNLMYTAQFEGTGPFSIDQSALFPWEFIRDINEGGYSKKQRYQFHQQKAAITNQKAETYKMLPWSHDMISAFYYARTFDFSNAREGDIFSIPTFVDEEVFTLKIKFIGRETIHSRTGTYRCLKFVPVVQEGRIFEEEEDLVVWITDDKNKIPILIKASVLVGSIKMELVEYKNLAYPVARID